MTFDFHPEAREEFHDAAHWYEERSIYAGDRFVGAVRKAINAILTDPAAYPPAGGEVRVYRLKKYPFKLYYTFESDREFVCIYAVMHEKRRPEYWRKRIL